MTAKEKFAIWYKTTTAKSVFASAIFGILCIASTFAYNNISVPKDAKEIQTIKEDVKDIKKTVETLSTFKVKTEVENENAKTRMMRIEDKLDKLVDKFIK